MPSLMTHIMELSLEQRPLNAEGAGRVYVSPKVEFDIVKELSTEMWINGTSAQFVQGKFHEGLGLEWFVDKDLTENDIRFEFDGPSIPLI
jgi:hypothetical protein